MTYIDKESKLVEGQFLLWWQHVIPELDQRVVETPHYVSNLEGEYVHPFVYVVKSLNPVREFSHICDNFHGIDLKIDKIKNITKSVDVSLTISYLL